MTLGGPTKVGPMKNEVVCAAPLGEFENPCPSDNLAEDESRSQARRSQASQSSILEKGAMVPVSDRHGSRAPGPCSAPPTPAPILNRRNMPEPSPRL